MDEDRIRKQHIILVHGACHGAWCWYKVATLLKSAGHRVTAPDLAAAGIDPRRIEEVAGFADYSQPLLDIMASLPAQEKVILVGHSFGGMSIALAADKFPEKVAAAVFVTAFMPDCTSSPAHCMKLLQLQRQETQSMWMDTQVSYVETPAAPMVSSLQLGPQFLASKLYQPCSPECIQDLTLATALVRPSLLFAEDLGSTPAFSKDRYGHVPRFYVVCSEDAIIVKEYQQWMIQNYPVKKVLEIDCIPPHIDHHDFVRPFCTVSFLTECNILFGSELKVLGPGDFSGSSAIPLPVGSVLILKGNGADVAKHCVPAVPSKRISITFRKMDDSKLPFRFTPDPELRNLRPLPLSGNSHPIQRTGGHVSVSPVQQQSQHQSEDSDGESLSGKNQSAASGGEKPVSPFQFDRHDFPSLGSRTESRVFVSPVQQQQAQHRPHLSQAQQASSRPRSWNSGDNKSKISPAPTRERSEDQSRSEKNQFAAHGEKPVSQFQLDQGNFPSLSSSAFSKPLRKPGRSLRQ